MCVFWGSMCLKLLLKDDFESSKCWLDPWLSCMHDCTHIYIFPFLKNWFSAILTPYRHLAIYRAFQLPLIAILIASRQLGGSIEISSRPSIASRQLGGSIEISSRPSIASRQLVDRSSFLLAFCWFVPQKILDSFICRCLFARHLSTPLSVEIYWTPI